MVIIICRVSCSNYLYIKPESQKPNCQAQVPSPVPFNPIPNPEQSKSKSKSNWDWGDTIITWATTHPTPPTPLITFNHEGVL